MIKISKDDNYCQFDGFSILNAMKVKVKKSLSVKSIKLNRKWLRVISYICRKYSFCVVCVCLLLWKRGTTKSNVKSHFHDKSTSFKLKWNKKRYNLISSIVTAQARLRRYGLFWTTECWWHLIIFDQKKNDFFGVYFNLSIQVSRVMGDKRTRSLLLYFLRKADPLFFFWLNLFS